MSYEKQVRRIIERIGQSVTFKSRNAGSFNNTTLVNTLTYTDYTITAAITDYAPSDREGLIQQGDRTAYIAAESLGAVVPKENDQIIIDSKRFDVTAVNILQPQTVKALYIVTIKGHN